MCKQNVDDWSRQMAGGRVDKHACVDRCWLNILIVSLMMIATGFMSKSNHSPKSVLN